MATIIEQLEVQFCAAIRAALSIDADPLVGLSQNPKFGDYQCNAAMGLAKRLAESTGTKTNPRSVAEQIMANLDRGGTIGDVSIAGPGFINVTLSRDWLSTTVGRMAADDRLGVEPVRHPQPVIVDYSGPNVAKLMHVGHLRSTVIGDALVRVIGFLGHTVVRQNHIGDWGTQFGMLIAYLKSIGAEQEAGIGDLDDFYKKARVQFDADPETAAEARATVVRLQAGEPAELNLWGQIVAESRADFQPIYDRLGVLLKPGDERGESFYNPMLAGNVAELKKAGVATVSEGAVVVFTDGSDTPLIVEKTGGGYGYATTDLAAIRYRAGTLGAARVIYVVGSPQGQHFKQVFAAARRAGWAGDAVLEHAAFGSVLGEDGKMFKTRSGGTVKLVELLDEAEERGYRLAKSKDDERVARAAEKGDAGAGSLPEEHLRRIGRAVGLGAIKYADLSKDRVGDYTFAWDQMLAMDGNTAPYLQYAYARIQSIFRRAAERNVPVHRPFVAPVLLDSPAESTLAKHLVRFGDVVAAVGRELKPHLLCTYLYELASNFSGFFENCPVLQSDDPLRASRLSLCEATGRTLGRGLELLGIEHPERM